jgi:translation elongation factor EF-Tu-like GTPase
MNAQHVKDVSHRLVVYGDISEHVMLLKCVDVDKALPLMNKRDVIGHFPLCVFVYYELDNYYIYVL